MKRFIITNILLGFILSAHAQMWENVSQGNINAENICFALSENKCIVGGQNGKIYKTEDGGVTYDSIQTIFELGHWFVDIDFPSDNVGYISGGSHFGLYKNFLIKTTDGGETWNPILYNLESSSYTFNEIDFIDENIGFVAGDGNLFLKTEDGGQTFEEIDLPIPDNLGFGGITDVHFVSDNIGFISIAKHFASDSGQDYYTKIYRTEDQGETWDEVYGKTSAPDFTTDKSVYEMGFYSEEIGYACGSNGFFLKTIDGGDNWTETEIIDDVSTLGNIEIRDNGTIYLTSLYAYAGNVRRSFFSEDQGQTWTQMLEEFYWISFSGNTGYAIGDRVNLYRIDNLNPNTNPIEVPVSIYPTLASDKINIVFENDFLGTLGIIDELGRKVGGSVVLEGSTNEVDISYLSSGVYFLKIEDNNGNISTTKITKI